MKMGLKWLFLVLIQLNSYRLFRRSELSLVSLLTYLKSIFAFAIYFAL